LNKLRKRTDYKKLKLNLPITRTALENTANSRNSFNEIFEKVNKENYLWQITLNDIKSSKAMQDKWKNYTHQKAYARRINFQDTLNAIEELMLELFVN
ncbi:MAG: hypothetical protein M3Z87_12645, partial [Lactobacillus sp.]|nr:hypothetical protein [Lactobacillus sp.]